MDLSRFQNPNRVAAIAKETTYSREYKEKKAQRDRARTQAPGKKLGKIGDSTYKGDYIKKEAFGEDQPGKLLSLILLVGFSTHQNHKSPVKFNADTAYHEEYLPWAQEAKRSSSNPPKVQPSKMERQSIYGKDYPGHERSGALGLFTEPVEANQFDSIVPVKSKISDLTTFKQDYPGHAPLFRDPETVKTKYPVHKFPKTSAYAAEFIPHNLQQS